ncbi:MAG: nucleotide exchange factor GrpE [Clostridiales bacterium]|nr:nucleotide exchange factor GrpE [Clostridiales bacterium]
MSTKKTRTDPSDKEKDKVMSEETPKEEECTDKTDNPENSEQSETAGKAEPASETEEKRKKKDKLAEDLEKLQQELAAEKDKYLRMLAEYDNYRKRSQRERECVYSDVRADTVALFLPVYDNLERALKQETCDAAYSKGVEMIMSQFKEILQKLGVTEIEASVGTAFDPAVHNAVMHIEDESFAEGVIAEEFQKGFRLGDKIIRCSIVKVAN